MQAITIALDNPATSVEVSTFLEERFDATWFPAYGRCSIERDAARVFVDYDRTFPVTESGKDVQEIPQRTATPPSTVALHIQISTFFPDSRALASEVVQACLEKWGGIRSDGDSTFATG